MYFYIKRFIDFILSLFLLFSLMPILIIVFFATSFSTKSFGIFKQKRVGFKNKLFYIFKFKTMYDVNHEGNDFNTAFNDSRITNFGKFLRKSKLDELPQLLNILLGDMSFVGPRPDVQGYAECQIIDLQYLLKVRPGVTSEASLFFRNEEFILSRVLDKKEFNDNIIWPIKLQMNNDYSKNCSFSLDIIIILKTINLVKYKKFDF